MVSDISRDVKFSRFTLAVLKDSGWYEVDLELGEQFFWGKNEGCSIFSASCPHYTVSEFCSPKDRDSCSDDHIYRTSCSKSTFTGSCKINVNVESCKVYESSPQEPYKTGIDSMCLRVEVNDFFISK
jgi:hypothetical protein